MIRHTENMNLSQYFQSEYRGFSVQIDRGPLIHEYLGRLNETIQRSLADHPRTFAFRVDLRFPSVALLLDEAYANAVIERFFASFKAKIEHNRYLARKAYPYAHDTRVRYVWAREIGQQGRPHYHVLILLNNDAFCTLGNYEAGRENMFNRLEEAWASALRMHRSDVHGLVEIPLNGAYLIKRDDVASQAACFYRSSYLCKAATKMWGDGVHCFGSSRI